MTRPATLWTLRCAIAVTAVALAVNYVIAEHRLGALGFPLDDGWIHARFAQNLANGHGFSFNPDEPSTGSTAPLWTALLAVPMVAGAGAVASAKLLGILLAAAGAVLAFELARALTGSTAAAAVAGFATALSARLTWGAVSGMEVPLYVALSMLTLLLFARFPDRGRWWGLAAALATLARPETGVVLPILIAAALCPKDGRPLARRATLQAALVFAAVTGAAVVLNLVISGRPLPATFYAKTGDAGVLNALLNADMTGTWHGLTSRPLGTLNQLVRFTFEQSSMLFLFVLPGVLALVTGPGGFTRRGAPVALLLVFSPLVVGAVAPVSPYLMQEGRYVANLLAAFFVVAAVGAADLAARIRRPGIVWAIVAFALVRLLSQNLGFADRYAAQVDNINRMHVAIAHWLADATEPDESIAVNDIGAIGFFANRRIIDLEGLVTPEVLPYRKDRRYVEFVSEARPALLVIFPEWYPELVRRNELFREIHRVTVPRVTAAHDSMVVYVTPWKR